MPHTAPLADRARPKTLDEMVGQQHLIAPGRQLRRIIESGRIPNMIFYGPSGVGKTTLARIIAANTNMRLCKLNGTSAGTADIKEVIAQTDTISGQNGVLLYLDEIQYLNKKQQQSLLEYIENGKITLIASTTENPYFYVYNAILSRSTVFEFKPVPPSELQKAVRRAFSLLSEEYEMPIRVTDELVEKIAYSCGGDVRKAMNAAELCCSAALILEDETGDYREITPEAVEELSQRSSMRYDRDGDAHYDILSAYQKSIRGSDPDAAMHYLARLIEAGDLPSICRRTLVIAAEDIGLAYPQAIAIVKSCIDAALQLGFPEARIPLAEAVLLLCTCPKSNSAINAIDAALADVQSGKTGDIPAHLKDGHYAGAAKLGHAQEYQYPHAFPHHWVSQQYLPDELKDAVYYEPGENKFEAQSKAYWDKIKK